MWMDMEVEDILPLYHTLLGMVNNQNPSSYCPERILSLVTHSLRLAKLGQLKDQGPERHQQNSTATNVDHQIIGQIVVHKNR